MTFCKIFYLVTFCFECYWCIIFLNVLAIFFRVYLNVKLFTKRSVLSVGFACNVLLFIFRFVSLANLSNKKELYQFTFAMCLIDHNLIFLTPFIHNSIIGSLNHLAKDGFVMHVWMNWIVIYYRVCVGFLQILCHYHSF